MNDKAAAFDGREQLGGIVTVYRPSASDRACYGCLTPHQDAAGSRGEGLFTTVTMVLGTFAAHIAAVMLSRPGTRVLDDNVFVVDGSTGAVEPLTVMRRVGCEICRQLA
jgi:hypothetical protein